MLSKPIPVICVVGPAGAGKTRMLAAAVDAWQTAGIAVFGVGPSATAARQLPGVGVIPRRVAIRCESARRDRPLDQWVDTHRLRECGVLQFPGAANALGHAPGVLTFSGEVCGVASTTYGSRAVGIKRGCSRQRQRLYRPMSPRHRRSGFQHRAISDYTSRPFRCGHRCRSRPRRPNPCEPAEVSGIASRADRADPSGNVRRRPTIQQHSPGMTSVPCRSAGLPWTCPIFAMVRCRRWWVRGGGQDFCDSCSGLGWSCVCVGDARFSCPTHF